jgi:hypothetical protein
VCYPLLRPRDLLADRLDLLVYLRYLREAW